MSLLADMPPAPRNVCSQGVKADMVQARGDVCFWTRSGRYPRASLRIFPCLIHVKMFECNSTDFRKADGRSAMPVADWPEGRRLRRVWHDLPCRRCLGTAGAAVAGCPGAIDLAGWVSTSEGSLAVNKTGCGPCNQRIREGTTPPMMIRSPERQGPAMTSALSAREPGSR
jgi:hypothetical protein